MMNIEKLDNFVDLQKFKICEKHSWVMPFIRLYKSHRNHKFKLFHNYSFRTDYYSKDGIEITKENMIKHNAIYVCVGEVTLKNERIKRPIFLSYTTYDKYISLNGFSIYSNDYDFYYDKSTTADFGKIDNEFYFGHTSDDILETLEKYGRSINLNV